jgi:hypothetical protein
MKVIHFTLLSILIASSIIIPIFYLKYLDAKQNSDTVFYGVSFGGKTANEAKLSIDRVKNYTNFFLVNSWDITINETALNEVCNYAAQANLKFMVFFDFISLDTEVGFLFHREWVITAEKKWGEKFLGIYIFEEPGGKQIDTGLFDEFTHPGDSRARIFENVTTYDEASEVFITQLPLSLSFQFLLTENIPKFTSDYALYWFDYLAGYDTIFTEFGWNLSRAQHIGLCRGAAKAQNKDWGTIITWTYDKPPYLLGGSEIFEDMILAYEGNAKYIILFNFPYIPEGNPYGILLDEHFVALEDFWKYTQGHPQDYGKNQGDIAFVLPKNYGWGMRFPGDKIWGLWDADSLSINIWEKMNRLIKQHGIRLDIIYEDPEINLDKYSKVVYWNEE